MSASWLTLLLENCRKNRVSSAIHINRVPSAVGGHGHLCARSASTVSQWHTVDLILRFLLYVELEDGRHIAVSDARRVYGSPVPKAQTGMGQSTFDRIFCDFPASSCTRGIQVGSAAPLTANDHHSSWHLLFHFQDNQLLVRCVLG